MLSFHDKYFNRIFLLSFLIDCSVSNKIKQNLYTTVARVAMFRVMLNLHTNHYRFKIILISFRWLEKAASEIKLDVVFVFLVQHCSHYRSIMHRLCWQILL